MKKSIKKWNFLPDVRTQEYTQKTELNLQCKVSQNGQTNFKNPTAFAARF